jgi:uncharacterized protein (TIGR04222 family)
VNPLDFRGPQFLLFYLAFGVVVTVFVALLRRQSESKAEPGRMLTDYQEIAFLRGGANEALRVIAVTLVNRGLLKIEGSDQLRATRKSRTTGPAAPAEQLVLDNFHNTESATSMFSERSLKKGIEAIVSPGLVQRGLLPDAETKDARRTLFLWALLVLGGLSAMKIAVAIARGHANIQFLIVLTLAFGWVTWRATHPRRTRAGDLMLADLERLFGDARNRALVKSGARTDGQELGLLAAVFGVAVLSEEMPEAKKLFPQGSSSSDGSSSCGSSSGSSCGSSCGGGGGCGGCGS